MAPRVWLALLLGAAGGVAVAAAPTMRWGPPVPLLGGGKMSNTLDMGEVGFASGGFAFTGPSPYFRAPAYAASTLNTPQANPVFMLSPQQEHVTAARGLCERKAA